MLTSCFLILAITFGIANFLVALTLLLVTRSWATHAESELGNARVPSALAPAPFVSVHVAIHDEPPALVIATLEALARLDYPQFEVLVIDNNTPDPAVWQPVQHHVERGDGRFRFYHFGDVAGAKAGALNIALQLANPRSEYVAVVDADYQVAPDFLSCAVAACGPAVQFVQFPQAYRSASGAGAVVDELADYFETFPRAANRAQASLLTGTLSVIAIDALRRVGGWPTGSITEDAELGLALWSAGARGLYIDKAAGNGLLPLDLEGLRTQRRRWVTGNVQTLLAGFWVLARSERGTMAVVAQLTAWLELLAIPLLTLIFVALARSISPIHESAPGWAWRLAEAIAVATFACVLTTSAMRAIVTNRVGSLGVTMALIWTSSFAWTSALRSRPLKFQRTPKAAQTCQTPKLGLPRISLDTAVSLMALGTSAVFAAHHAFAPATVLALSASGLLSAPFVDRSLRKAAA
jgi:cellulose synthase/poly-beta-1,6-N-acetylglucosamine synthase-like glycosyltransferase